MSSPDSQTPAVNESNANDKPALKEREAKKRKLSGDESEMLASSSSNMSAFKEFKLIKVLREDDRHKLINLHGSLPLKKSDDDSGSGPVDSNSEESDAVVVLERKPFDPTSIEECIRQTKTKETLHNDIYSTFEIFSTPNKADMRATLIFPATEKHISKYSEHQPFIVNETPDLYRDVTLPCIEASKFSIQWVYNILDKTKEADRIVTEDSDPETGFVLIPDLKWDRQKMESLYLVAIVHKRGLRSLRDLTAEHLPLLKNVLQKGQAAIKEQFGVGSDKLRIYFHYQPSYYHLHIHFSHIRFDAPGTDVMRAHLLSDVIDNLSINPDFYKKKTLSYVVRDSDQLYEAYEDNGYFQ
ncbi:m7GpppX diphosphatase [Aplysia californica]|uniref:m7GpppX diphosphatase n=1 Tax=Aplysia californica TaxID=6500 RepID=A0ABM0JXJ6_APLCA|nr:m7GpppX diphosphatase [Aplysia californica]